MPTNTDRALQWRYVASTLVAAIEDGVIVCAPWADSTGSFQLSAVIDGAVFPMGTWHSTASAREHAQFWANGYHAKIAR